MSDTIEGMLSNKARTVVSGGALKMSVVPGALGVAYGPGHGQSAAEPGPSGALYSAKPPRSTGFAGEPAGSRTGGQPGLRAGRPTHSLREPREVTLILRAPPDTVREVVVKQGEIRGV